MFGTYIPLMLCIMIKQTHFLHNFVILVCHCGFMQPVPCIVILSASLCVHSIQFRRATLLRARSACEHMRRANSLIPSHACTTSDFLLKRACARTERLYSLTRSTCISACIASSASSLIQEQLQQSRNSSGQARPQNHQIPN